MHIRFFSKLLVLCMTFSCFLLHRCLGNDVAEKERTLAIIKPDGLLGNYTDEIKRTILRSGFVIADEMEIQLREDVVKSFYSEHSTKSFFPHLVDYMTRISSWKLGPPLFCDQGIFLEEASMTTYKSTTMIHHLNKGVGLAYISIFLFTFLKSGPVVIMILEKVNAVADWRALIGPTDASKAKLTHPQSIRATCGTDLQRNCVHGSDSPLSAAKEIAILFKKISTEVPVLHDEL